MKDINYGQYDLKLLQDICPYTYAYGHTLSNYVSGYRSAVAEARVLNTEKSKTLQEFFERFLRSYLITKNISYSKSLIEKDMRIKEADLKFTLTWEQCKPIYNEISDWYKELQIDVQQNKTFKTHLHALAENYAYSHPESNISEMLLNIANDTNKSYNTYITIEEVQFLILVYNTEEHFTKMFYTAIYRTKNNKTLNTHPIRCNLFNCIKQFPELLGHNEWSENK